MTAPTIKSGDWVVRATSRTDLPIRLKVQGSRCDRVCEDCRTVIHRGDLHASLPYTHVCLRCVRVDTPPKVPA
jgi:hypothetical protein